MTEETLFAEAIALPLAERSHFLEEACGGDEDLRKRVEILIQAHDEAETFLAGSAQEDHEATLAYTPGSDENELSSGTGTVGANPDAPVPFVFGPRIAQGGMGAILEADDCKFGRKIAVKVMLSEAGQSKEQKKRFVQEAAVLGKLEHPNIVPVHDLGRDSSGDLYYSMKLVKGRTLQDVINDLREEDPDVLAYYTLDRLLTIFRKVCDAIAFAHAENIIHRDLKPENIMVGEFGEVLVMDWGISKILDGSDEVIDPQSINPQAEISEEESLGMTLEGSVMGTPQYMSPEQAAGEIGEMDARSDIYSLGGILYAILTLRPPVEGDNVFEILDKVQTGELTPITTWQKSSLDGEKKKKGDVLEAKKITPLPHIPGGRIPAALSAVAMKALALGKAERYQNIASLGADIEKWQGGFATSAEQAGLGKQLALLIKRNKGIFTTAAAAWVLITGLAVWFILSLQEKERRAVAEAERATEAEAEANLALADAFLREGNGLAMQEALGKVPEDLRDSTWNYLQGRSDTSLKNFPPEWLVGVREAAPHPKIPSVFAIGSFQEAVILVNCKTNEKLKEFKAGFTGDIGKGVMRLAFSPSGEHIAAGLMGGDGNIVIHRVTDGKKLAEWETLKSHRLEFNRDGTLLLQSAHLGSKGRLVFAISLRVWDVESGELLWERHAGKTAGVELFGAFTPDGKHIAVVEGWESPKLFDAREGTPVDGLADLRTSKDGLVQSFAIGATGRMAVGDSKGRTTILDPNDGSVISRIPVRTRDMVWSPDGKQLVTAALNKENRQEIRVWDSETGTQIRSLLEGRQRINALAVHPVSGELLVAGWRSRAWDLTGAQPTWNLYPGTEGPFAFWKSDDSIFSSHGGGKLLIYWHRSANRNSSPTWKPKLHGIVRLDVSANGERAALSGDRWNPHSTILILERPDEDEGKVKQIAAIPIPESKRIHHLRLSPKGDQIIGFDNTDLVWFDADSGETAGELETGEFMAFNDVGWLGDDRIVGLVTINSARLQRESEEWVVLWDAASGSILQKVRGDSQMDRVTVAPDGNFAEAGADKMIRIRDGETLEVLHEFRAHDGPITAMKWHRTKPILATASTDHSVRLWNTDTFLMMEEFRGPVSEPLSLCFSPGGTLLGCAAQEDRPLIWEPESLKE